MNLSEQEQLRKLMYELFFLGFDHGMNDDQNGYSNRDLKEVFDELMEDNVLEGVNFFQLLITGLDVSSSEKWIDCKDVLPEGVSNNYLVYRPNAPILNRVCTLWYDTHHNGWSGVYPVTYWKPLPSPPETK